MSVSRGWIYTIPDTPVQQFHKDVSAEQPPWTESTKRTGDLWGNHVYSHRNMFSRPVIQHTQFRWYKNFPREPSPWTFPGTVDQTDRSQFCPYPVPRRRSMSRKARRSQRCPSGAGCGNSEAEFQHHGEWGGEVFGRPRCKDVLGPIGHFLAIFGSCFVQKNFPNSKTSVAPMHLCLGQVQVTSEVTDASAAAARVSVSEAKEP